MLLFLAESWGLVNVSLRCQGGVCLSVGGACRMLCKGCGFGGTGPGEPATFGVQCWQESQVTIRNRALFVAICLYCFTRGPVSGVQKNVLELHTM